MGLPGYWAVLFRACCGRTPRRMRARPRLADDGRVAVAFEENRTLGIRNEYSFRGRIPHGPRARMPTLRRSRLRDRRQARYRLGWLGPSPGGIRTRWTTYGIL